MNPDSPAVYVQSRETTHTEKRRGKPGAYDPKPPSHITLEIQKVTRKSHEFFGTPVPVGPGALDGDRVILVTVRYSDGDSYKTTYGYHRFMGVFATVAEAEALKTEIESKKDGPYDPERPWQSDNFCHLESVDITDHLLLTE